MLSAQERAREVDGDDIRALLVGQFLEGDAAGADAGIVEQQIDAAVGVLHRREQPFYLRRVADVGRHGEGARRRHAGELRGLFEHVAPAPGQHDIPAGLQQRMRAGPPDAAARASDDRDFPVCRHVEYSPSVILAISCHSGMPRKGRPGIHEHRPLEYGFRARRCSASRNDGS